MPGLGGCGVRGDINGRRRIPEVVSDTLTTEAVASIKLQAS